MNLIPKVNAKRPWAKEEDSLLLALIDEHGSTGSWPKIATYMNGRTGKQCRERYLNQLDPNIKKGEWTKEEDAKIIQLQQVLGKKWSRFMEVLPGRSDNAIKNRWHVISRDNYEDNAGSYSLLKAFMQRNPSSDSTSDSGTEFASVSVTGSASAPSMTALIAASASGSVAAPMAGPCPRDLSVRPLPPLPPLPFHLYIPAYNRAQASEPTSAPIPSLGLQPEVSDLTQGTSIDMDIDVDMDRGLSMELSEPGDIDQLIDCLTTECDASASPDPRMLAQAQAQVQAYAGHQKQTQMKTQLQDHMKQRRETQMQAQQMRQHISTHWGAEEGVGFRAVLPSYNANAFNYGGSRGTLSAPSVNSIPFVPSAASAPFFAPSAPSATTSTEAASLVAPGGSADSEDTQASILSASWWDLGPLCVGEKGEVGEAEAEAKAGDFILSGWLGGGRNSLKANPLTDARTDITVSAQLPMPMSMPLPMLPPMQGQHGNSNRIPLSLVTAGAVTASPAPCTRTLLLGGYARPLSGNLASASALLISSRQSSANSAFSISTFGGAFDDFGWGEGENGGGGPGSGSGSGGGGGGRVQSGQWSPLLHSPLEHTQYSPVCPDHKRPRGKEVFLF